MAKQLESLGATWPNFGSMIRFEVSTYQSTGTSDFQVYLQHRINGSVIIIQSWRSSTGGVYNAIDTWTWSMALLYTQSYKVMMEFKPVGGSTANSIWYDTPLVDYEVGPFFPELLANVISAYMRGTTVDYICDDTYGLPKPGVPSTTTMRIGVKLSLVTAQSYFDTYTTTLFLKNTSGTPATFPNGQPHVTQVHTNSALIGSTTPITTTTEVQVQTGRDIGTVRSYTYVIRSYGGSTQYLESLASDSFRTAALMSAMSGTTSMGIFSSGNTASTTYRGQLGVLSNQTFPTPSPSITATTFPYLAVKAVLLGEADLAFTIWNTTSGYLYVKAKPSNMETYFMNSGSGTGTNKLTTLQGTIDIIAYKVNAQGHAVNTFVIPAYNISYQSDLTYISTRPNQFYKVTHILQPRAIYPASVTLELYYYYATTTDPPLPGPPVPPAPPVPEPPVPEPIEPSKNDADELLREQKAVEDARQVVDHMIAEKSKRQLYPAEQTIWYTNTLLGELYKLPDGEEKNIAIARVVDVLRSSGIGDGEGDTIDTAQAAVRVQALLLKHPSLLTIDSALPTNMQFRYEFDENIKDIIAFNNRDADEYVAKYNPDYRARWGINPVAHFETLAKNYIRSPHKAAIEQYTMIPPLTGADYSERDRSAAAFRKSLGAYNADMFKKVPPNTPGSQEPIAKPRKQPTPVPAIETFSKNKIAESMGQAIMTRAQLEEEIKSRQIVLDRGIMDRDGSWSAAAYRFVGDMVAQGIENTDALMIMSALAHGTDAGLVKFLYKTGSKMALKYLTGYFGYETTEQMLMNASSDLYNHAVKKSASYAKTTLQALGQRARNYFSKRGANLPALTAQKSEITDIPPNAIILPDEPDPPTEQELNDAYEKMTKSKTPATQQALAFKNLEEPEVEDIEMMILDIGAPLPTYNRATPRATDEDLTNATPAESDMEISRETGMHIRMTRMSDYDKHQLYARSVGIIGRNHLSDHEIVLLTDPIFSGETVDNRYETTMALQKLVQKTLYAIRYEAVYIEMMRHVFSSYFNAAMNLCWEEQQWHGYMQYRVFKSLIHPQTPQERVMQEKLLTFVQHRPLYDARTAIDTSFKAQIVEMEEVLKKTEKVQNFIERITDHLPDTRKTAFNGVSYITTRSRRSYELPMMAVVEKKVPYEPRPRVVAREIIKRERPTKLSYIQKRDEPIDNMFYEAKRRKFA